MRFLNSLRNASVSILAQIFNMVLSFVCRTIFIKLLSTEYLGLSGLFTNILSVLSLSELGLGNAIIISLYKPLANKDEIAICKYMNFYRSAYRLIGIFMILFGLVSMPFLRYMVNTDVNIPHLHLIYFLYVLNSAVSYFFAYKRTIITVDQKEYINTINRNIFLFLQNVLQIVILLLTHSYILYVCVMILCSFLSNVRIAFVADKLYPFLKNDSVKLQKKEIRNLFKSLKAIMYHKIGNVIINSTDNIIISVMLGVFWVGIYSNYSMIVTIVTSFVLIIFSACSASIGNLNASEDKQKVLDVFKVMMFLGIWVYGITSICFLVLFQPFITIWIGDEYLVSEITLSSIVVAYFVKGIVNVSGTFMDVTKLFIRTRYIPWIMAIINVVTSIIGAKYMGLTGVFIGTVLSYALTQLWINPYMLYKYKFKESFGKYILFFIRCIIPILFAGTVTYIACAYCNIFVIKMLICILLPNIILVVLFLNIKEFKYVLNIVQIWLENVRKRKNA